MLLETIYFLELREERKSQKETPIIIHKKECVSETIHSAVMNKEGGFDE